MSSLSSPSGGGAATTSTGDDGSCSSSHENSSNIIIQESTNKNKNNNNDKTNETTLLTTSQENLELLSMDANLSGLNTMFQEDDSEEEEENKEYDKMTNSSKSFDPTKMQSYQLEFNNSNISLSLIQASSAFSGNGEDETGLVLWGASVTLSQFLINEKMSEQEQQGQQAQPDTVVIKNKFVLELGCGSAVPSLVAYKLGASRIVATDFSQTTLDHVLYHADQNTCNNPNESSSFDVQCLNWEDHLLSSDERRQQQQQQHLESNNNKNDDDDDDNCNNNNNNNNTLLQHSVDVILASDVIYGISLVPALIKTIKYYCNPKTGRAIIATRDGRRGITEFRHLMQQHFIEIHANSYNESYLPSIPIHLQQDDNVNQNRWNGNHSIYIYCPR